MAYNTQMVESERRLVSEFTEQDVASIGLSVDQFYLEAESLGNDILDGHLWARQQFMAHNNIAAAVHWGELNKRRMIQIGILSQNGEHNSILGQIENVIVPMADALSDGHEGRDYEDEVPTDDYPELLKIDGVEVATVEALDQVSPEIRSALKVGVMFTMYDTVDELVRISQAASANEDYKFYQSRVLFFRMGELLVKTNGICLADLSSSKRREKIGLVDQCKFLINLAAGRDLDPEQSELGQTHPIMTQAHFRAAANILDMLQNFPGFPAHTLMEVAAERFTAVAEYVAKTRGLILEKLTSCADMQSDQIRALVEESLNADSITRAAVIKFLKLDQPANIWSLYRHSVAKGERGMAELAKAQALGLFNRPFLVTNDLPVIYDSTLSVDLVDNATSEQIERKIKSIRLNSSREFVLNGDDLLLGGVDYGPIRVPDQIKVVFDRNVPQRKFQVKLEYLDPKKGALVYDLVFDLQKGGLIDWSMLASPLEPEMAGLYQASVDLTRSLLDIIKIRCEVRAQEREAMRGLTRIVKPSAPAKKGPHVPAPKFTKQDSISHPERDHDQKGETKVQVRDIIVIPEGEELVKFLKGLRGQPQRVIDQVLGDMRAFNEMDTQVGLVALRLPKNMPPIHKWGCSTEVGGVRTLLFPVGSEQIGNIRIKYWRPDELGLRNGYYQRRRGKFGFDSKDV